MLLPKQKMPLISHEEAAFLQRVTDPKRCKVFPLGRILSAVQTMADFSTESAKQLTSAHQLHDISPNIIFTKTAPHCVEKINSF
ncbi:hypothetical protein [Pseudomonas brassicacearum]|uniref:hypothetical protein n=1 Tax=Pseudomonas brassicacearum TaxID=930166 RepID=UPI001295AA1E|nr:hypothetical protein [Pseudomonas brassicacearum]QGA47573.1 hypothetical protein GFU70_00090 [Pseudomonas brassicacearum]